ncbi:MAG: hypothetical protein R3E08_01580 [Thiotrichaceae bacterium]
MKNYAISRYGEFDPTHLFSLSFLLMFGMMFGDALTGTGDRRGGMVCAKVVETFQYIFYCRGVTPSLFGLVYGSVFGKHILTPLWIELPE